MTTPRCRALVSALALFLAALLGAAPAVAQSANQPPPLLSDLVDVSPDFRDFRNAYYLADSLSGFDPASGQRLAHLAAAPALPPHRLRQHGGGPAAVRGCRLPGQGVRDEPGVALRDPARLAADGEAPPPDRPAGAARGRVAHARPRARPRLVLDVTRRVDGGHRYTSASGSVTILEKPWHVELRDAAGRLLTHTQHTSDFAATLVPALPFSFVRRSSDFSRSVAAVFSLEPGEKLFGTGESFTRLDKRGQKVVLWTNDANGVQTERMYKPIPFFLSSRGYGMFVHTSAPATFDMGASYHGSNALLLGRRRAGPLRLPRHARSRSSTSTRPSPARRRCRRCGPSASG